MTFMKGVGIAGVTLLVSAGLQFVRGRFNSRAMVKELENVGRNDVVAQYAPRFVAIPDKVRGELYAAYEEIARCYTNGLVEAMREVMLKMPKENELVTWQSVPEIDAPILNTFGRHFLWAKDLKHFANQSEYGKFARLNIDLAVFYGSVSVRRKDFETAAMVEYRTLLRLKAYEDLFQRNGCQDLADTAHHFVMLWIDQIESEGGLARQAARHAMIQNTILADAISPGRGLSHEKAIRCARAMAIGLIRCGYTPKWLDEEFPAVPVARVNSK